MLQEPAAPSRYVNPEGAQQPIFIATTCFVFVKVQHRSMKEIPAPHSLPGSDPGSCLVLILSHLFLRVYRHVRARVVRTCKFIFIKMGFCSTYCSET